MDSCFYLGLSTSRYVKPTVLGPGVEGRFDDLRGKKIIIKNIKFSKDISPDLALLLCVLPAET